MATNCSGVLRRTDKGVYPFSLHGILQNFCPLCHCQCVIVEKTNFKKHNVTRKKFSRIFLASNHKSPKMLKKSFFTPREIYLLRSTCNLEKSSAAAAAWGEF